MLTDNVNPLALAILIVACVVVWFSRHQFAVNAIMTTALFIPLSQMFIVGGLHVRFLPILILVSLARTVRRGELRDLHLGKVDKLFFAWCFVLVACTSIRQPTAESFGDCFNTVGAFLVFRALTRETDDIIAALRFLALLGLVMGMFMIYEGATGRNFFYVLGGVPGVDLVRDGRVRCQGAFRHPLMAGAFGATLLPLMVGLWLQGGKNRRRGAIGIIGSLVITITAVSSGALLTFLAGLIGMALWRYRERMSLFRRSVVVVLIILQIVMKAPVWYLISKISDVLGGSGWHRSFLIDQFIRYFDEWWLIGTDHTAHWAPGGEVISGNTNMMDITNHYIAQALKGGLLGFVLFIAVLVSCFKIVGRLVRADGCGGLSAKSVWMLGVTMAAHSVAFISVWYFDQITTYWTWLAAAISALPVIHAHLEAQALATQGEDLPEKQENSTFEQEPAES
jgi:hypothetical protein